MEIENRTTDIHFHIPYNSIEEIHSSEYKNLSRAYWRFIGDWKLHYKPEIIGKSRKRMLILESYCLARAYTKEIKNRATGIHFHIPYNSKEEIPSSEYKNLFRAYWRFVGDWKLHYKPKIIGKSGEHLLVIETYCFACAYAQKKKSGSPMLCSICPLVSYRDSEHDLLCLELFEPYTCWKMTNNPKYAYQIAELEWED